MSLHLLPTLADLAADPGRAVALPVDAAERLLTQAYVVVGVLLGRLLAARGSAGDNSQAPPQRDSLVSVREVATRLGRSLDYIYRRTWPFEVKGDGRGRRFSAQGLDRYIRQRQGQ